MGGFFTGLIRLFFNENFGWQKEKPTSLDKTQALGFDFVSKLPDTIKQASAVLFFL